MRELTLAIVRAAREIQCIRSELSWAECVECAFPFWEHIPPRSRGSFRRQPRALTRINAIFAEFDWADIDEVLSKHPSLDRAREEKFNSLRQCILQLEQETASERYAARPVSNAGTSPNSVPQPKITKAGIDPHQSGPESRAVKSSTERNMSYNPPKGIFGLGGKLVRCWENLRAEWQRYQKRQDPKGPYQFAS
jgi:hypothetical protein